MSELLLDPTLESRLQIARGKELSRVMKLLLERVGKGSLTRPQHVSELLHGRMFVRLEDIGIGLIERLAQLSELPKSSSTRRERMKLLKALFLFRQAMFASLCASEI